jgi:hypothetical protein
MSEMALLLVLAAMWPGTNVNMVLLHEILESLVKVFSVGNDIILGLCIICNVDIMAGWGLDLN